MMDEFRIINQAKEALCYVAPDFEAEVAQGCGLRASAECAAYREWVLPDYQERMTGHVRELEVSEAGYLRRTRYV